jgi:hypothetical protein
MGLLTLVRVSVGEVGVKPGTIKMVTTDNLVTITAAGYLNGIGNQLQSIDIAPSDVIECLYSYSALTDSGSFTFLAVSITNGLITLSANNGNEALTNGHIFVGNAANIATDVAMTGDISITNAGVTAIVAGVIVNADINAAAAIAFSKLAALTSGNILVGSAGNVPTAVTMSGDATIIASGALTIANSAITNAKVAAAAAIDFSKLAAMTSGSLLIGSALTVPTVVAMSGDATIIASGALTIANDAITTVKILNANVTLAKLAAGITPSHVIKFANQVTTAGGAAAEAFTVTGAVGATDRAFVQVVNDGTSNVTVLQAVVTDNTLTVTFSANPGNDTVINYQLIRAAA